MRQKTTLTLLGILLLVLGFADVAQAYYNPQTGSWLSRDPLGDHAFFQDYKQQEVENLNLLEAIDKSSIMKEAVCGNLYTFINNDGLNEGDKLGLHVLKIDRKLGAKKGQKKTARCPCNPWSHTYIVVIHKNRTFTTYSWGNIANPTGWNKNKIEDKEAVRDALKRGLYEVVVGNHSRDLDVHNAYEVLKNDPGSNHNWRLFDNCKDEADKLLKKAGI